MLNRFEILNQPEAEDSPFLALMPAEGAVTQGFSYQTGHYGVDIVLPAGTPFLAISDGVVFYTEWTVNYGYGLVLQHPNGIVNGHKQAKRLLKKEEDLGGRGDVEGRVGVV